MTCFRTSTAEKNIQQSCQTDWKGTLPKQMSFWAAFLKTIFWRTWPAMDSFSPTVLLFHTNRTWGSFGNIARFRLVNFEGVGVMLFVPSSVSKQSQKKVHEACWYSVRCYTWFTVISSVREKVAKDATRTQTVTIFCEMPLWIMYSKVKRRHRSFLCHPCLSWLRLSQWKILCLNGVVFQQSP